MRAEEKKDPRPDDKKPAGSKPTKPPQPGKPQDKPGTRPSGGKHPKR